MAPKGQLIKKKLAKGETKTKGSASAKKVTSKVSEVSRKKKPIVSESSDESDELEMRNISDSSDSGNEQVEKHSKVYGIIIGSKQ